MAGDGGVRHVTAGRWRGLVSPEAWPPTWIGPDVDPDRLVTSARCQLLKFQTKVIVGRIETGLGPVYVKRYNVHAWRVALESVGRPSPAVRAFRVAEALRDRGFQTPAPLAAIEHRRAGVLRGSFFLTREVADACTADVAWARLRAMAPGAERRGAMRALARGLGRLFRQLHDAGIAHGDLKDVNVLVRGPREDPTFVLLDLEDVRVGTAVSARHRVKNLVQLARTLGPRTRRVDHLRFLAAYAGDGDMAGRRRMAERVMRGIVRKNRGRPGRPAAEGVRISCTVVCQDEAMQIAQCLESVRWCDEIVVVDGGSRDATVEIARRYTDRVVHNPWPGYRAQKQFALQAAREPWVLNLDADERISDELATEIRRAVASVPADVDGFSAPRLVSYLGRWWYRGGWYPRPVLRLVRRAVSRWGGTDPHDRPVVPGKVVQLGAPIFHYTYDDVQDHLRTVSHLTDVAAAQVPAGHRVGSGRLLAEPIWRFVRAYVLKRGWVEGVPGFFVAATDAFYVFVRWARVWDRERRGAGGPR